MQNGWVKLILWHIGIILRMYSYVIMSNFLQWSGLKGIHKRRRLFIILLNWNTTLFTQWTIIRKICLIPLTRIQRMECCSTCQAMALNVWKKDIQCLVHSTESENKSKCGFIFPSAAWHENTLSSFPPSLSWYCMVLIKQTRMHSSFMI